MVEHGRGSRGHYQNCWRSMAYGFEILAARGESKVIFIGQNLFPGVSFGKECEDELDKGFHLLMNRGCLRPDWFFTEYMAANPIECMDVWQQRLGHQMLEGAIKDWTEGHPIGGFPALYRPRDVPWDPSFTFCFHEPTVEAYVEFAKSHGFYAE